MSQDATPLEAMTLKSLQEKARELGISRVTGINKADLIASIESAKPLEPVFIPRTVLQRKRGRPRREEVQPELKAPEPKAKPVSTANPAIEDALETLFSGSSPEPASEPRIEARPRPPRHPVPVPVQEAPADGEGGIGNRRRRKRRRGKGNKAADLFEGPVLPGAPPSPARQQPIGGPNPPRPKPVHDDLPVSTAPTVMERIAEIEPKLGGNIINEGTLELMPDGFGFLRSLHYHLAASPDDIYVSQTQVRRFNLRQGDTVVGIIRPPKVGERYFALLRVEGINGRLPEELLQRPDFEDLLPVYPDERYDLEHAPSDSASRVVNLFAPIGKGTRGLIVAQPKTGKTTMLRTIANSVATNHPEAKILILLVDERPEEVTEMQRTVHGAEVMASTFDQRPESHKNLAEVVFDKAKRLVEAGHDVLLLLDSITRLARAYNIVGGNSGRTMSGGVDSEALKIPRQLFSSARNIEGGGSLTIVATALVETGSRMDDVIFEEFKGTGNMEIVLDRRIANMRVFPAIDIFKSGTRKEELIVPASEREKVVLLRRYLTAMSPQEAMEFVLDKMKGTRSNMEFLLSMNQ
jgi:transcription termination factor Rho